LNEIKEGLVDGIVIRNILSTHQLARTITNFKELIGQKEYSDLFFETPFGNFFGTTLMEDDLVAYFSKATIVRRFLGDVFEGDFDSFCSQFLRHMSDSSLISPARNKQGFYFSPASVRMLRPGMMDLNAHIHQEFPRHFPSYGEIVKTVRMETELSFYFQIIEPEIGGELVLYDMTWKDTPSEMISSDLVMTEERNKKLSNGKKMTISLEPGDALVFAANRIWHQVNRVKGGKERLTVGGFLALSKEENSWNYFI